MTVLPVSEETIGDLIDVLEWAEKRLSPPGPTRPREYGEAAKTAADRLLSDVVDMCESPATDDEAMEEMASDIKRFLMENGTPYVAPYDRWQKSQQPTPSEQPLASEWRVEFVRAYLLACRRARTADSMIRLLAAMAVETTQRWIPGIGRTRADITKVEDALRTACECRGPATPADRQGFEPFEYTERS